MIWGNCWYPFIGPYPGMQNPDVVFGTTKRTYTERLEQWLKRNNKTLDPLDPDELLQAGLNTVFKNIRLNVLDEKYRETFVVQFLNEFYMYEIGQETEDAFRQNLNKLIQIHGKYINGLYEMAEKQFFINYSYRVQKQDSTQDTTNSGTSTQDTTNNTNATNSNTHEATANDKKNETNANTKTGNESFNELNAGTENRTNTGTDTTTHKGTDTTERENHEEGDKETDAKKNDGGTTTETKNDLKTTNYEKNDNTDTTKYDSNTTRTPNLTDTTLDSGSRTNTRSGSEKTDYNSYTNETGNVTDQGYNKNSGGVESSQRFSDTPQSSISALDLSNDMYLTNATVNGTEDTRRVDNYNDKIFNDHKNAKGGDDTVTYNNVTDTESFNNRQTTVTHTGAETNKKGGEDSVITDGTKYNEAHESGSITTEHGNEVKDNIKEHSKLFTNGTDTTTHDTTDTSTKDLKDDTVRTDSKEGSRNTSETDSSTLNGTNERTESATDSGTNMTNQTGKTIGTTSSTGNTTGTVNVSEEHYEINRDAVFMSNDITDRIWELFNECFMLVG